MVPKSNFLGLQPRSKRGDDELSLRSVGSSQIRKCFPLLGNIRYLVIYYSEVSMVARAPIFSQSSCTLDATSSNAA